MKIPRRKYCRKCHEPCRHVLFVCRHRHVYKPTTLLVYGPQPKPEPPAPPPQLTRWEHIKAAVSVGNGR